MTSLSATSEVSEAATNHKPIADQPRRAIAGSPVLGAPPPVTRSWTDTNGNYVPDCDLLDPNANTRGGDTCGQLSNANFGKPVFSGSFDPTLLEGSGVRPSDWQIGVSVQQHCCRRWGKSVTSRWLQNFTVIVIWPSPPLTSSLHIVARRINGGQWLRHTVSGLYNVNRASPARRQPATGKTKDRRVVYTAS